MKPTTRLFLTTTSVVLTISLSAVGAWIAWVACGDTSPLPTLCGLAIGAAVATAAQAVLESHLGD
jgi:hypothetical protein